MGLNFLFSSCCCDSCSCITAPNLSNPNPRNFIIRDTWSNGVHTVVSIMYPDCTNYEGKKILVFSYTTIKELKKRKVIDPHFCKSNPNLIARFAPTDQGWQMAVELIREL